MPDAKQQQHVQFHRKIDQRQRLLTHAIPGAAFVPYCGDGDIAAELYADRPMIGCDTDPARVAFVSERLPGGRWTEEDADAFDFSEAMPPFAIADFDAYAYPYDTFRNFWTNAPRARRVVMFFTDGAIQNLRRGVPAGWRHPDGTQQPQAKVGTDGRAAFNFYWTDVLLPWITAAVAPWRVIETDYYSRGGNICYWGAVVEAPAEEPSQNAGQEKAAPIREGVDPDTLTDADLGYDPMKVQSFDAKKKRRFLALIAQGSTLTAGARAVGITPRTVYNHFERYPKFQEAYDWCSEEANASVENALYRAALSGNVTAIQVWLYNRAPERWADRRQHRVQMVTDDETLKVISDIISRSVTDPDTLARLRAELTRLSVTGAVT